MTEAEENTQLGEDDLAMFDLKKKKKKSKKEKVKAESEADKPTIDGEQTTDNIAPETVDADIATAVEVLTIGGVVELDPPNYPYSLLLQRVVDFVHSNNPDLADKKRFTMKPPQLMRG